MTLNAICEPAPIQEWFSPGLSVLNRTKIANKYVINNKYAPPEAARESIINQKV